MELLLVMVLVCGAAAWMASPLIARARPASGDDAQEAALEAARDAKFREIRDLDLDHRMGKLSLEDFRPLDATLRAEAIDLLRRLDALRAERAAP
jgi:hypothetical protein